MEADDDEFQTFVNGDAGRDVPEEWTNFAFRRLSVDNGHHSSREYDVIVVRQGQMFYDKVHLQHPVKRWAFSKKMEFNVVTSNPMTYDVKCTSVGCTWRVHGYLPKCDNAWVASIVENNSCKLRKTLKSHRNMTT